MFQKLFQIGISVRLVDLVFQRLYVAAAIPAEYGLHEAEQAWHTCTANHQSSGTLSLSGKEGWVQEGKQAHWVVTVGEKQQNLEAISYLFSDITISDCMGNRCVCNAREQYYAPHKITLSNCI